MVLAEWCRLNHKEYILEEWSEKNDLTPDEIGAMSNRKVIWNCPKNHEYTTPVANRTSKFSQCPICCNKVILKGYNDLGTTHPKSLKEWDFEKNDSSPYDFSFGAHKIVWWKCENGHSYQKRIKEYTKRKTPCPVCSGYIVNPEYNSLQATHPEILKEWDYEKNMILPTEISAGNSKTKVWWICEKGHSYSATPNNRTLNHSQCPKCARETQSSFREQAVFYYMKKYFPDSQNGNRELISPYELDVYIPSERVAIEYDGEKWHKNKKKDVIKSQLCEDKNITLYRIRESKCPLFTNNDNVYECSSTDNNAFGKVVSAILEKMGITAPDVQIYRDRELIYERYIIKSKENSIASRYPELIKEWDYSRNGKVTPDLISFRSDKAFWWLCKNGHSFRARTADKTAGKAPCWYCSNRKILAGFNDLASHFPNLIKEWDYKRNKKTPEEIIFSSTEMIWWICEKGHSYRQRVYSKTIDGQGCPYCSNRRVLPEYNSLAVVYPKYLLEWNYDKNSMSPTDILPKSSRKVWWKCSLGHEWQAKVSNRTKENGTNCPFCNKIRRQKSMKQNIGDESAKEDF